MQVKDRTMTQRVARLLFVAILFLLPSSALAESVTVLMPPADDGQEGAAARLYNALRAQVELHPDYTLNDVPAQTLDEALLMLGCTTLDAECSSLVEELLESRYLLYGELSASGERIESHLTLWDLRRAQAVRVSEQSLPGDLSFFEHNVSVFARAVLYGDDATISITSTPAGATIFIDGEPRGTTPIALQGENLGAREVEIRMEGHQSYRETLIADIGNNEVEVTLEELPEPREIRDMSAVRLGTGYSLLSLGGVGLLVGTISAINMVSTQNDFDSVAATDPARAQSLLEQGDRHARLANVGFIAGGALVAGGTAILLVHRAKSNRESPSDDSARLRWAPSFGAGSAGLQVSGSFR